MKSCKKVAFKYYCKKCDYGCKNKYNFNKHLSTTKHKMITNDNKMITKSCFICPCGKSYKFSSGLSRHSKVCPYTVEKSPKSTEAVSSENHALLLELKEMKEIMKKHGYEKFCQMQSNIIWNWEMTAEDRLEWKTHEGSYMSFTSSHNCNLSFLSASGAPLGNVSGSAKGDR